jgi:hypothetical protein
MYVLEVRYSGLPEWPSPDRFDERLEKHLGRKSSGSGFGGMRDITWSYQSEVAAEKAAEKVRTFIRKEKEARYRKAVVAIFCY